MITLLIVFIGFILAVGLALIIAGMVAVSPLLLIILIFPVIDVCMFRALIGRKKKKKSEED